MKTGRDLLSLARTRIGEEYVFGALVPKDDRNWHGPWDCAEFVSWDIYQVAQILYGCNSDIGDPARADAGTVYWARDARAKGRIISVDQAAGIRGAKVLRLAANGVCGHIVFSDGRGGTIEAADTRHGVIAGTLHGRRWSFGILVPGIDYEAAPVLPVRPATGTIYRYTDPPMTGPAVVAIQHRLQNLGYLPEPLAGLGIYGPKTAAAVRKFQAGQRDLVADGEAGPLTLKALGVKLDG